MLLAHAENPAATSKDPDCPSLAYNVPLSQSGWAAPFAHFVVLDMALKPGPPTGAHAASARAVMDGAADMTAVDALTWTMIEPENARLFGALRIIDRTVSTRAQDPEPVASTIDHAIATLSPAGLRILQLKTLIQIPASDYLAVSIPPTPTSIAEIPPKK